MTVDETRHAENTSLLGDEVREVTMNGCSQGIGCRFIPRGEQGHISIIYVREDSIAQKAGIKVDDVILEVNGSSITGATSDEVVQIIKRGGETITFKVKSGMTFEESDKMDNKSSTVDITGTVIHDFAGKRDGLRFTFLPVDGHMIISEVKPGGLMAAAGIKKFDELVDVNGRIVMGLMPDEVCEIIKLNRQKLSLRIRPFVQTTNYRPPRAIPQPERDTERDPTIRDVILENRPEGLGFSFVPKGVFGRLMIHQVFDNMQAQKAGIRAHEELISVNGTVVSGWPSKEIVDFIKHSGPEVRLKIKAALKGVVPEHGSRAHLQHNLYRHVRLHHCRNPNGIGLKFVVKDVTGRVMVVEVEQNSVAEKSGLIKREEIMEINGEAVTGLTTEDIVAKFQARDDTTLKVKRRNDIEAFAAGF